MNQLIDETVEFLGHIPPFQFLEAGTLAGIAASLMGREESTERMLEYKSSGRTSG